MEETSRRSFDFAVLATGIAAVSTAALLIREANAPSLVIAAFRLSLASLPLLLLTGIRRQRLPVGQPLALLTLLSGVFLALHFGFWVASVKQTSIVTSVVLVTTTPLFIGIAGGYFLNETPGRSIWLALAVAAVGTLIMVSEDFNAGGDTLAGDAFGLLGGLFATGFLMIGRRILGAGSSLLSYTATTYSIAALLLLVAVLISGESLGGYSGRTYLFLVLLALVPQLIGHTAVNFSLGRMPAIVVSLAILGEPVGSTILAAIFLGEDPSVLQLAGGLLVLAGVAVGVRADFGDGPMLVLETG
jgi:drug/metabolite transporter (DMT)-like permease